MIVGADVGGTFTDVVAVDAGVVTSVKVPTTHPQSDGVVDGARALAGSTSVDALIHGTTVATNALLERAGARTALITDAGFEDIIEIGRQDRPTLYDPFVDRSEPLVGRRMRFGMGPDDELPDLDGAEAVAVAFVDGHEDPAREQRFAVQVAAKHPGTAISLSSFVAPEFREFERVSTTVLNAYLTPITSTYLAQLESRVAAGGLTKSVSVMRSSGGLMSLRAAGALPAAALLSGPAGGVVATRALARRLDVERVVSFDMGGTSTDVCLIEDGEADISYERDIDGYVCRLPAVGIHTVGAGGGSIAWIDPGGALRVGPRSAGSEPGPACYRRGGTEATVTDANVVLGRIGADAKLGGSLTIDAALARTAVGRIADALGLGLEAAALGIIKIAEATMAGAVRSVSTDRGSDPAAASLVAFGGAGGLHAAAVARSLGMAGVIVPPLAGVFSALGLLLAPPRADVVAAVHVTDGQLGPVEEVHARLVDASDSAVGDAGHTIVRREAFLDARYVGQAHELSVPWEAGASFGELEERFSSMHRRRYGFARDGDPIELVAVRVASFGAPPIRALGSWKADDRRTRSTRTVVTGTGQSADAVVLSRSALGQGDGWRGPLLIEEDQATTYVDTDESLEVLVDGSLEITW